MGNCCNSPYIADEIANCSSIDQIQQYISLKIKDISSEQEELKEYLKDKNKKTTLIDVSEFKDEDIEKRIPYLEEMKDCFLRVQELLKNNPKIDVNETKIKVSELYNMYTWLYDDEKRYESWMINFKDFIENGGFQKLEEAERSRGTMPVKGTKTLKEDSLRKYNEN